MAKRHDIEMNFRKARQQAAVLEDTADTLQHLSGVTFNDTLETVAENWMGESASLYLQKGAGLQDGIRETALELRRIAEEIRRTAQRIYDAEIKHAEQSRT